MWNNSVQRNTRLSQKYANPIATIITLCNSEESIGYPNAQAWDPHGKSEVIDVHAKPYKYFWPQFYCYFSLLLYQLWQFFLQKKIPRFVLTFLESSHFFSIKF